MRPADAATLIIVRDNREVLLGLRSAGHVFMPHKYVFPGGRVDVADGRVQQQVQLRPAVLDKLQRSATPGRARALAMAAVRETYEETGLVLGRKLQQKRNTRSAPWQTFFDTGMEPALDHLDYVARAITPPGRVRRFDARFFLVDARFVTGELKGNGELDDLNWVPIVEAKHLPLAWITGLMLKQLHDRLIRTSSVEIDLNVPFYRERYGRQLVDLH